MGTLLTLTSAVLTHKNIDAAAQADFQRLSDRAVVEISARFRKPVYGLNGARGMYAASKNVSRADFQAYVDSRDMPKEFPGVRGFGFIRHVERSQLPAFLESTRKDGSPGFSIRQLDDKSWDDLLVIEFIEPLNLNKAARGLDVGSETMRRAAAMKAIDTGTATITGAITLVQDERRTQGVLLFVPVYATGSRLTSPEERRAALRGVLYAPVVMDELLADMPDVKSGQLDFELYDSKMGAPFGTLMFDADDNVAKNAAVGKSSDSERNFSLKQPLVIEGRDLMLSTNSTAQFDAAIDHSKVIMVLIAGELLSALLAFILYQQATARQKAQLLAESMTIDLDNLAQVVKRTANSVTICDTAGRITWVNEGFTTITGYTLDEALGRTAGELIGSPNSDPQAVKTIQAASIAGEMCRAEILNKSKSGIEYWIDTEIQPQFDATGNLNGFMEIGTDVTAKKKAQAQLESALRDSSALVGTLDMHAIISMADREGNITEVNDAFCEVSGYSRIELIGQNHRIVKSSVQGPEFWDRMWADISSGKSWRGQICNQSKDGFPYWVDTFIAPFLGNDGLIEKYISIRIDITEAKKVERSLALERQRLNVILDSLGEGVYTLDPSGKCNYLNAEAEKLLGWSFEELQGRPIHDIIHHHKPDGEVLPSAECPIYMAMQNSQNYRSDNEMFFRKDGTGFQVSMTGSPLVFEGKKLGSVAVFSDITQAKRLQSQLEAAKVAAEIASSAKGQFLANMSHEIRTPMNAILGMLKLLGATDLNARQTDYADKAESSAKALLGLLNDILDFSKIEAGKMELDPQPFSMERLLRDLSVIVSSNLGQKPVEVLFDLDPNLPAQLVGDSMRLQQVLINLSGNAVKFTERGEIIIQVKVVQQSAKAVRLRIAVKDSGIGISPENQKRLFSDFTQAEASTTRRFGGTGLGLSICKRLVKLMGGDLLVDSAVGQGSTFHFEIQLPVVRSTAESSGNLRRVDAQSMRVLVVDDNAMARDLISAMALSLGWQVDVAQGGAEALHLVQQAGNEYQAIFMDWDMPGMDGWETIERVRAALHGKAAPITVMVTASGREALSQRSAQEQALLNAFLVKPITATMLREVVSDAQDGRSNLRSKSREEKSQTKRLNGMRILVVEDNLINQQVARELLIAEGALVEIADNGLLGLSAITHANSGTPFDVVLMDLQMPVMDGFEATRAIRLDLGLTALPIIAMTANAMASDREACLNVGMNDHIGKPFDLNNLVQVLLQVSGYRVPVSTSVPESGDAVVPPTPSSLGNSEIDVNGALARMSGMRTLYTRLVGDFIKALDGAVSEFERLLSIPSLLEASRHAHTLKGTASTLGAMRLARFASELETVCKTESNSGVLLNQSPVLAEVVRSTQMALRQVLEVMQPTSAEPVATATQRSGKASIEEVNSARLAIEELSELLRNADLAALQRLAELREVLAVVVPEPLEALEGAMQGLEFEDALKFCQQIAVSLDPTISKS